MGYFKNIQLKNYRNFSEYILNFNKGCNIICGKNGSGKTNILESISLFEKGTGFRKDKIINLVNLENQNQNFSVCSNFYHENTEYKINILNSEKNSKKLLVNENVDKESIKNFESLFSIIYFLPEMERLFDSSPSARRNFIDRLIFTYNKKYNYIVNSYKKSVYERQTLLKKSLYDESWMLQIEKNIVNLGSIIYKSRLNHIEILNKILIKLDIIKNISHNFCLKINDSFLSDSNNLNLEKEYSEKLKLNRKIDLLSGGCRMGPHRSDIVGYKIENNLNINQFSTGQQKTSILLIIIAQCKYLIDDINIKPIILLDEICSHLDDNNRELLLYLINELNIQVFMTGTEKSFFSFLSTKANYCNIT